MRIYQARDVLRGKAGILRNTPILSICSRVFVPLCAHALVVYFRTHFNEIQMQKKLLPPAIGILSAMVLDIVIGYMIFRQFPRSKRCCAGGGKYIINHYCLCIISI